MPAGVWSMITNKFVGKGAVAIIVGVVGCWEETVGRGVICKKKLPL